MRRRGSLYLFTRLNGTLLPAFTTNTRHLLTSRRIVFVSGAEVFRRPGDSNRNGALDERDENGSGRSNEEPFRLADKTRRFRYIRADDETRFGLGPRRATTYGFRKHAFRSFPNFFFADEIFRSDENRRLGYGTGAVFARISIFVY